MLLIKMIGLLPLLPRTHSASDRTQRDARARRHSPARNPLSAYPHVYACVSLCVCCGVQGRVLA